MTSRISLACASLALVIGLFAAPAAFAADDGDAMAKPAGGAMMHKGEMKKHKKKDSMMHGTMMKKDTPAQ